MTRKNRRDNRKKIRANGERRGKQNKYLKKCRRMGRETLQRSHTNTRKRNEVR